MLQPDQLGAILESLLGRGFEPPFHFAIIAANGSIAAPPQPSAWPLCKKKNARSSASTRNSPPAMQRSAKPAANWNAPSLSPGNRNKPLLNARHGCTSSNLSGTG